MAEITWGPFLERQTYNRRRDIHAVYGGQQQGGICTPSDHPVIFLFTYGYGDGWTDDGSPRPNRC
jgi:5-methylcytosine-specific restriction protein A